MYQPNSIKTLLKIRTNYNQNESKWANQEEQKVEQINTMKQETKVEKVQPKPRACSTSIKKRSQKSEQLTASPQQQQTTKEPARPKSSDKHPQMQQAEEIDEDDAFNPRNFLNTLYADDNFLKIKEQMTEDLIKNISFNNQIDQKELMNDVDNQIKDLKQWRLKKEDQQLKYRRLEQEQTEKQEKEIERMNQEKYDIQEDEITQQYNSFMRKRQTEEIDVNKFKMKKDNNTKELLNQQVHSKINERLQSKENYIKNIEQSLKEQKEVISYDKREWGIYDSQRWEKKEKIMKEFVDFEEQVNKFDEEMNDILFGVKNDTPDQPVTDEEINKLLLKIKSNEDSYLIKDSQKNQDEENINNILQDIENEFKELDDIMKEVDEVTNYDLDSSYQPSYAPGD